MKKHALKSISFILTLSIIFLMAFSANAVNFNETKSGAFLKKFAAEKALSIKIGDINQDPLTVSDIVLSAKLNDTDALDINASAHAKLSFLSADVFYNGKDLTAYFWIFKVNANELAKNLTGGNVLSLPEEQLAEITDAFKSIIKLADSPFTGALVADSITDTVEKFSVSAVALLASASGANEEVIQQAMAQAGYDIKDKTDKEIKDMLVAANKAGVLLPVLKAAGSTLTQEDLDMCMEYIYDSFEFTFTGSDVKDIALYDENGSEIFRLSKTIPFEVKSVSAGEGSVKKAPVFSIDATGFISGIIGLIIGGLG